MINHTLLFIQKQLSKLYSIPFVFRLFGFLDCDELLAVLVLSAATVLLGCLELPFSIPSTTTAFQYGIFPFLAVHGRSLTSSLQ